jgi:hypothetical protein
MSNASYAWIYNTTLPLRYWVVVVDGQWIFLKNVVVKTKKDSLARLNTS